ncbi:MAG: twitching motility protein PilT [Lentisphaerae bacterium RIFOXYC12_FULL_60_16]|nr:MAG: twitching motility protein PilT [Lentisphaerae bacterium RIFOXYC12_FULL_60_16]OGV84978.1 MAG: twitching motility protein PilT [Lentisphaerae bacterium RIFOXYB12_FULL_60_10]
MKVLVDSSVWVAYFRGTGNLSTVDLLIEENLVVTNDLILAELTPPLFVRGERKLITLLKNIECSPLVIDWEEIINLQVICIRNGINKVGLPDLIIAQNAMQNDLALFSLDKHFALLSKRVPLNIQ